MVISNVFQGLNAPQKSCARLRFKELITSDDVEKSQIQNIELLTLIA